MREIARRRVIAGMAAAGFVAAAPRAWAQDQGLLKRLQATKKVRVGIDVIR